MAKANQRFSSGLKPHSQSNEYKIPIKHRQAFMGNNLSKWVDEKKYKKYLKWCKTNG